MLYCPLRISSKVMGVGEAEVKLGRLPVLLLVPNTLRLLTALLVAV